MKIPEDDDQPYERVVNRLFVGILVAFIYGPSLHLYPNQS